MKKTIQLNNENTPAERLARDAEIPIERVQTILKTLLEVESRLKGLDLT